MNLPVLKPQSTKISYLCLNCKKVFQERVYLLKIGKGKFCSRECYFDKMRSPETIANIFWSHVIKTESCWIYDKVAMSSGYGNVRLGDGKQIGSHRFSYEYHFGKIPDGLHVCHKCDNRRCIRPDHLFLGTHQDNVTDMCKKGRQNKGESHWSNRLTEIQVKEIKKILKMGVSYRKIARDFNTSYDAVFDIKRNKTWKWVTIED